MHFLIGTIGQNNLNTNYTYGQKQILQKQS